MRKIVEAEALSDGKTSLRLTLSNGQVIEGHSLGIEPAFDEKGEELDYDVLAFRSYDPEVFFHLKDEDICKVEALSYEERRTIKQGIRPGTEQRYKLMKVFSAADIPISVKLMHTDCMRGKTDEEKERIAAEILSKIESGEIDLSQA